MGKPLDEATAARSASSPRRCTSTPRRPADRRRDDPERERRASSSVVRKEPVGPVAAITPWNYPLELIGWKLGGALGAGCTMVVKPSEYTPGAAQMLAECVDAAGFPPGVVNVVHGAGEVGALLAGAPGHRQDRLHRLQRDRAAALQDRRRRDPADAWSSAAAARCWSRATPTSTGRRGRRGPPLVPQRRPDLHRDQPDLRPALRAATISSTALAEQAAALTVADGYANPDADVGPVATGRSCERTDGARRATRASAARRSPRGRSRTARAGCS